MVFVFDQAKSAANRQKHGIDFVAAQTLWKDSRLFQVQLFSSVEPRHLIVGVIGVKHWAAIITYRGESVRLISVRRARKDEVDLYESTHSKSTHSDSE